MHNSVTYLEPLQPCVNYLHSANTSFSDIFALACTMKLVLSWNIQSKLSESELMRNTDFFQGFCVPHLNTELSQ